MSITVLDCLYNAQHNFKTASENMALTNFLYPLATEQLKNAITALENGKMPDDIIQNNMFSEIDTGEAKGEA